MSDPTAPPGFVRLDNLGDPALIRADLIATVYRGTNGQATTCVVLNGPTGPGSGGKGGRSTPHSLIIHVNDNVDDVGALIAAAVGG